MPCSGCGISPGWARLPGPGPRGGAVTEPLSLSPSSQARPSALPPSGSMSRSSRASRPTLRRLERTGWTKCGRRREATSESRYGEPGPGYSHRGGALRGCQAQPHPSSAVSIVCTADTCPGFSDLGLGEILASQQITVDKLTCKEK